MPVCPQQQIVIAVLSVIRSHLDLAGWYNTATSRACAATSLHSDETRCDPTAVAPADGTASAAP